jgi:hypothetical protein
MRNRAYAEVGGWPDTPRADFDFQLMANLGRCCGEPADPTNLTIMSYGHGPQYVFRWGGTKAFHGQAFGRSPEDTEWYTRVPKPDPNIKHGIITSEYDQDTEYVLSQLADWERRQAAFHYDHARRECVQQQAESDQPPAVITQSQGLGCTTR